MRKTRRTYPKSGRNTNGRGRRPSLELLEDRMLLALFTVTDTSDSISDTGSLRYAITQSNLTGPGPNTIQFKIVGGGVQTITPDSPLPTAIIPVALDGSVQNGYGATPLIVIDGSSAGVGSNGLVLNGGGSAVRALAVDNFGGAGILLGGAGDLITGCFVGVDAAGTAAAGNGTGIKCTADSITIGGTTLAAGNVVSANSDSGIYFGGFGTGDVVQGNFIGTDVSGTKALGNYGTGVWVDNPSGALIGGTTPAARNIISGNHDNGVEIDGSLGIVEGNYIGTDVTGEVALANEQAGVVLSLDDTAVAHDGSTIGGTVAGAGNVISGNLTGVAIQLSSDNVVEGNFIGTDKTGTAAVPNGGGVIIGINSPLYGYNNTIGGASAAARNVVSGNTDYGISLGAAGSGNVIEGNFIGTDVNGSNALPNQEGGIRVQVSQSGDTIGGTTTGAGNVISGNGSSGIYLSNVSDVLVAGNFIGTDSSGTTALPNSGDGVTELGTSDTFGGTTAAARNIISGNVHYGLAIAEGGVEEDSVEGNYIGTDVTGEKGLGNGSSGVYISALSNTIGGTIVGAGNLISDNGLVANGSLDYNNGVTIDGRDFEGAIGNVVQGNIIGADATGANNLGNSSDGVLLASATGNSVGGTTADAGNVIAFNGGYGIHVDHYIAGVNGTMNLLGENAIFGNAEVGIRLTNGGNNSQPAPILTSFTTNGTSTTIGGTLVAAPSMTFTLEAYANALGSSKSAEQGQTFLTSIPVSTDSFGNANFVFTTTLPPNQTFVTVTATDPNNNTSQFSVQATTTSLLSSHNPSTLGQSVAITAVVANPGTGTPTGTITFTVDGQALTPVPLAVVNGIDEAVFSSSTLAIGSHTITAAYSGDSAFASSVPATPLIQKVNPVPQPTMTSLIATANVTTFGQSVTFTAVVVPTDMDSVPPSGSVTFAIDNQMESAVELAVVNGMDQATFSTATLAVGLHAVTAVYGGDNTYGSSAAPTPFTHGVDAPTTTTLRSSIDPSILGQPVSFTATVARPSGVDAPQGSVSFEEGSTVLATVALDGSGQAVFTTTTLALGTDSVTAVYSATGYYLGSSSSPLMQQVDSLPPHATSTQITSSENPSALGHSVTFMAVVSSTTEAGVPTGIITFTVDGKAVEQILLGDVDGQDRASFTTSSLTVGDHTISAGYGGDASFAASVSSGITQIVDPSANGAPPINEAPGNGPTVVSVLRYGYHTMHTTLVLAFDQALDAASAQDANDYRIIDPAGRTIRMKSAVYDSARMTVTLHPRERIDVHYRYELIVDGTAPHGLTNSNGQLLEGAGNGKPDGNFRAPLTWRNLFMDPHRPKFTLGSQSRTGNLG